MHIQQLYTGCLAEAAYYIESAGEAAVIDPLRETEPYLKLAAERGAKIKYIFETHFHADFVSGHIDLAAHTDATIVYGPHAKPSYQVHVAKDGEEFRLGELTIRVLHTPGHTLESSCFLLLDAQGKEHAVFTGDTLFVGSVGRPDLAVKGDHPITPEELGSLLYDSLRSKIMPLGDEVIVYPAHGAGSACGKGIGKETFSTIGVQKAMNFALQDISREEFVETVTKDLPPPPAYFFEDARINMEGYDSIDSVMARNLRPLNPMAVKVAQSKGVQLLDTRVPNEFGASHVPGALNIGLNGSFAVWVGTLLDIQQPLIVITAPGKEAESILRLARVGFEKVQGYLEGGVSAWEAAGYPVDQVDTVTADAGADLAGKGLPIVDVRDPEEFASAHLTGAVNLPLGVLSRRLGSLDPEEEFVLHCKSGYRSMIAASILKAKGIHGMVNVAGGFDALRNTTASIAEPLLHR